MRIPTNLLAFAAGALIASSAIPQILDCMQNPEHAAAQSLVRGIMVIAGNALWICYALSVWTRPILIVSLISLLLNSILLIETWRAQTAQIMHA
jgi:uncharacterized protein with PQ loop repeat